MSFEDNVAETFVQPCPQLIAGDMSPPLWPSFTARAILPYSTVTQKHYIHTLSSRDMTIS